MDNNGMDQQKGGVTQGGHVFNKNQVHHLLTNVVYVGKVRYRDEIHRGEQAAILDEAIWHGLQAVLGRNGRSGGALVKIKYRALRTGILSCAACVCSIGHSNTAKGNKRYRYDVCLNAQTRGWHTCTNKFIPSADIGERA